MLIDFIIRLAQWECIFETAKVRYHHFLFLFVRKGHLLNNCGRHLEFKNESVFVNYFPFSTFN